MKTCTKCKKIQSKSEFCKRKVKKDGLQTQCKSCCKHYRQENKEQLSAYGKAYRDENKEQIAATNKAYNKANKEQIAAANKAYREDNKDHLTIYAKVYQEINKEQITVKKNLYYEANKEQMAATNKAWRQANPERGIAGGHTRRALKKNVGGIYTHTDIANLIQIQDLKCVYCKTDLILHGKGKYHVDHRMPLFLGGTNFPDNLQLLCAPCNLSKSYKHPDVYEKQINHNKNKEL